MTRIGLISDTHGLLRPQALAALRGSDRIVHAGDIGADAILEQLSALAPLTVVRGNNDVEPWAEGTPDTAVLQVEAMRIYVLHDRKTLGLDPAAEGFHAVVSGHSHQPAVERRDGVLYVNPGSAGPRRFKLPVSVAELLIDGGAIDARIIELDCEPRGAASAAGRGRIRRKQP